jgi:hypothetical protein
MMGCSTLHSDDVAFINVIPVIIGSMRIHGTLHEVPTFPHHP